MGKRSFAILTLVTALGLFVGTTSAAQGKGHGQGRGKGNPHSRSQMTDDGWERHDKYETRVYGPNQGTPPGWSKGNKTGWRDCGLPPGQAKKYGCNSYVHQGRRYYYYRDDAGRIIVRRPRIDIHF